MCTVLDMSVVVIIVGSNISCSCTVDAVDSILMDSKYILIITMSQSELKIEHTTVFILYLN